MMFQRVTMALFMSPKLLISYIGFLLAASIPIANCAELPISSKLMLSDVLRLGFRPSSMLPDNVGMLRCWQKQEIVLKFENGFECPIKTEDVTFEVYDDNQISSARISGDSDYPLGLDEAVEKAKIIFGKVGTVPRELDDWRDEVKKRKMFSSIGLLVHLNGDVRVGVQLLPTLQKFDQKPALLGMIVEWKYLGSGPLGGSRSKPVTTPPGFDWDMSYEAWRKRIVDKGMRRPADVSKKLDPPPDGGGNIVVGDGHSEASRGPVGHKLDQIRIDGKWMLLIVGLLLVIIFALWRLLRK